MKHKMQDCGSNPLRYFLDDGTLVLALPAMIDISSYTYAFNDTKLSQEHAVQRVLLDFSAVDKIQDSGIVAVMLLEKRIRAHHLDLLVLDASASIKALLESHLPSATWISSEALGSKPEIETIELNFPGLPGYS